MPPPPIPPLALTTPLPLSHQFCPLSSSRAKRSSTLAPSGHHYAQSHLAFQSPSRHLLLPQLPSPLHPLKAQGDPLFSFIQLLEQQLATIVLHIIKMLNQLPSRLTVEFRKKLMLSKQSLVELGSHVDALKQMLLNFVEDEHEI
ncbi:hypothetical protein HPP92_014222 [Vanilla planifolia]|uniref:Uncharacterized protein n=1 Tax=Vanilla planifolia TaxID=51239 RepID=A0A835QPV8_VANPL|nr:hypothetical protein HPP92_014222 [Vanilla planifolia]